RGLRCSTAKGSSFYLAACAGEVFIGNTIPCSSKRTTRKTVVLLPFLFACSSVMSVRITSSSLRTSRRKPLPRIGNRGEETEVNGTTKWAIFCRPEVFDKCRSREGFSDLVCLARCINALTFLYSTVCDLKGDEPSRIRDR